MDNAYPVLDENCCFGLANPYVCHSGSWPYLHFRGQKLRVCATSCNPGCSSRACKRDVTSKKKLFPTVVHPLLVLPQFDICLYQLQSLILLKDFKDFSKHHGYIVQKLWMSVVVRFSSVNHVYDAEGGKYQAPYFHLHNAQPRWWQTNWKILWDSLLKARL